MFLGLSNYAHLGRSIHQVLQQETIRNEARRSTKVGRNDWCPCGSGRKFKRCCGGRPQ